MRICLVATFPPSGRQLNEYAFYIARELQRNSEVDLIILADELTAQQHPAIAARGIEPRRVG